MSSLKRQLKPRHNIHMSPVLPPTSSPQLHIFGSTTPNPTQSQLLNTLEQKGYAYQLWTDLTPLNHIRQNFQGTKKVILIMTSTYDEQQIKMEMKKKKIVRADQRNVSLYTCPTYLGQLGMQNLAGVRQVLMMMKQLNQVRQRSIKLAGIHSINKSYSSTKEITRLSTQAHYQSLKYYRPNTQYGQSQNSLYESLIQIFMLDNYYQPFDNLKQAIQSSLKGKDKTLLVIPVRMAQEVSKLMKKKQKWIDVILIGPLDEDKDKGKYNSKHYLDSCVVLATNSAGRIYQYLKDKAMVGPHTISHKIEQLVKSGKWGNYQSNKNINNNLQYYIPKNNEQNQINNEPHHHLVNNTLNQYSINEKSQDQNGKKKVRKLKSPIKHSEYSGNSGILKEQSVKQQEINHNHINNGPSHEDVTVVRQLREEAVAPDYNNDIYYDLTVSEHSKMKKSVSMPGALGPSHPHTRTQPNTATLGQVAIAIGQAAAGKAPPLQPQKPPTPPYEPTPTLSSNTSNTTPHTPHIYKNPSLIIHQTSDQYRGSNLQPQKMYQQIQNSRYISGSGGNKQPMEYVEEKRMVYMQRKEGYGQPDSYYVNGSQEVIKEDGQKKLRKSSHTLNIYQPIKPTTTYNTTRPILSHHYRSQSNSTTSPTYNKLIKKQQIVHPQQIKITQSNRIIQQHHNNNGVPRVSYGTMQSSNYRPNSVNSTTLNYSVSTSSNVGNSNYHKGVGNTYSSPQNYGGNHQEYTNNVNNTYNSHNGNSTPRNYHTNHANNTNNINNMNNNTTIRTNHHSPITTETVRVIRASSREPTSQPVTTTYNQLNLQGYQRVQENGVVRYRKKTDLAHSPHHTTATYTHRPTTTTTYTRTATQHPAPTPTTTSSYNSPSTHGLSSNRDNSPKVIHYQSSPHPKQSQQFYNKHSYGSGNSLNSGGSSRMKYPTYYNKNNVADNEQYSSWHQHNNSKDKDNGGYTNGNNNYGGNKYVATNSYRSPGKTMVTQEKYTANVVYTNNYRQ